MEPTIKIHHDDGFVRYCYTLDEARRYAQGPRVAKIVKIEGAPWEKVFEFLPRR